MIKNMIRSAHEIFTNNKMALYGIIGLIGFLIIISSVNAAQEDPAFFDLSPKSGYAGFVYQLSLNGENFNPDTSMQLNMDAENLAVSNITFVSNKTLNFRVSIPTTARPGMYDLNITNPDGKYQKYKQTFVVMPIPPPNITGFTPDNCIAGSLVPVTITGQYFRIGGSETVTISQGSKTYTLQNQSVSIGKITGIFSLPVDTPAGSWNITVINPDRQQNTIIGGLTIKLLPPPEVLSIAPNHGGMNTPVLVTISGSNFLSNATVSLVRKDKALPGDKVSVVSNNSLTCVVSVPDTFVEGMWDVSVTNPDGQSGWMKNAYLSGDPASPFSLDISPSWGVQGTNREVNISGMAFLEGEKVSIKKDGKEINAGNVAIISNNEIACTIPVPSDAQTGSWDVVTTNRYGKSDVLKSGFFVYSKTSHLLAGINPDKGDQGERISAELVGYNLPAGSVSELISNGSSPIPLIVVGNNSGDKVNVSFTIPDDALPDYWDLKVKTPDGGDLTRSRIFRVMYNNTPLISSIQPDRARTGIRDLKVTITGKNFGDSEFIDSVLSRNATNLSISGATSYHGDIITGYLTIPNGTETGWYNLSVTRNEVMNKSSMKNEMFRVI